MIFTFDREKNTVYLEGTTDLESLQHELAVLNEIIGNPTVNLVIPNSFDSMIELSTKVSMLEKMNETLLALLTLEKSSKPSFDFENFPSPPFELQNQKI
jgi:hypothetical protein